jgi:hypothetical protein
MASPLFQFIVAMPLVVAVVLQDQSVATLAAAVAMLASGIAIVAYDSGSVSRTTRWVVQAAAMAGLAVYASIAYRRLRLVADDSRRAESQAADLSFPR